MQILYDMHTAYGPHHYAESTAEPTASKSATKSIISQTCCTNLPVSAYREQCAARYNAGAMPSNRQTQSPPPCLLNQTAAVWGPGLQMLAALQQTPLTTSQTPASLRDHTGMRLDWNSRLRNWWQQFWNSFHHWVCCPMQITQLFVGCTLLHHFQSVFGNNGVSTDPGQIWGSSSLEAAKDQFWVDQKYEQQFH